MKFDTSKKGFQTLFKPYQVALLVYIWEKNTEQRTGITSSQAYEFLQQTGDSELMVSRATIIVFLNRMVEEGLISFEEVSGKGGYHKVYYPTMSREQFAQHIVTTITKKLEEVLPSIKG